MGLFDWLSKLFGGTPGESPAAVADRLERFADRFENAGDVASASAARAAAEEARRAPSGWAARRIEAEFLKVRGLQPDGRPMAPAFGRTPDGADYARVGGQVRAGGSRGWRYNNPGYVRCSPRSSSYGSIGCDGEFAVFPDHDTGARALWSSLRDEYPNHTVRDALREHLPPEAGLDPEHMCGAAGLDPDARVETLTDASLAPALAEPSAGQCYDPDTADRPDWVDAAWDQPSASPDTGDATTPTDNS